MTVKVERKSPYQGVPQWGITGASESTPSKATAEKWARLENASRTPKVGRTRRAKAVRTRPTFEQACAQYVHRYTMDHKPQWAEQLAPNGKAYAPHYRSDREWYENTLFYGESEMATRNSCYSSGATWPLGLWLDAHRPSAVRVREHK